MNLHDLKETAQLLHCVAQQYFYEVAEDAVFLAGDMDSPIESKLMAALILYSKAKQSARKSSGVVIMKKAHVIGEDDWRAHKGKIALIPQFKIGKYRADIAAFLIGSEYQFCIECDGHDFHERTKEQVARDKRRDRDITRAGFRVVRFAGSEIHANPMQCAEEFFDIVNSCSWHKFVTNAKNKQVARMPVVATPFVWKDPSTLPRRLASPTANDNAAASQVVAA